MTGLEHPQTAIINLLGDLLWCYRTVEIDNFFPSSFLEERLLQNDLYLVGTLEVIVSDQQTKLFRKGCSMVRCMHYRA
jgi:hypothetical protein